MAYSTTLVSSAPTTVFTPGDWTLEQDLANLWQRQLSSQIQASDLACIVVDMSRVASLDSKGLGVLVSTAQLAQTLGKQLMLSSVPPAVKMILEITQLDQVLPLVD